jgi:manganese transport protein
LGTRRKLLGCEIAIAACDLAEVLGAAIALQLLFGIPLLWGVCLTATDVFLVLYLQNRGFRYVEAIVLTLILGIASCFAVELWMAKPDPVALAAGLIPQAEILRNPEMLYISIGILGATVMPHNLYLHSSIVQTRMYGDSFEGKKEAIRYATIDSTVALMSALFINAAILIMAAAVFHPDPQYREVADIGDAYLLLNPLLGATVASTLFAVALQLCHVRFEASGRDRVAIDRDLARHGRRAANGRGDTEVGQFFDDFSEVTDDMVVATLCAPPARREVAAGGP